MIVVKSNIYSKSIGTAVLQGTADAAESPKRSWFGRNWRKIVGGVVGLIGGPVGVILGPLLMEAIEEMLNGAIAGEEILPYDEILDVQSEYEYNIMENWLYNLFIPKYSLMVKKANLIFTTTDSQEQVKLINELNNELAVVKEFLNQEQPKLSQESIDARNSICRELIYEVEKIIFQSIDKSPYEFIAENIEVISSSNLLSPIYYYNQAFKAVATNYTLGSKSYSDNVETVEVLDPINDEIVITDENNGNTTGTTNSTATTTTTTTTTTTETPKPKKSGLGLFAGLLFGTAVLIVAASTDDDKKKKPKQK
jgi:hypothetical protein